MSTKSGGNEGGGGGGDPKTDHVQQHVPEQPGPPTMTPAAGRGSEESLPCRLRSFAEILNEEKLHRNILEVKQRKWR